MSQRSMPDVITVSLEIFDFFHRIVIVHSNLHVIRSSDNPLLARHKFPCAHGKARLDLLFSVPPRIVDSLSSSDMVQVRERMMTIVIIVRIQTIVT